MGVVFVVARQELLGVVEAVGSGLSVVEVGWGDPFGAAVFAFSGGPAFVDEPVGPRRVSVTMLVHPVAAQHST